MTIRLLLVTVAVATLAACGTNAGEGAAGESGAGEDGVAAPAGPAVSADADADPAAPATTANFAAYVGKYPFDAVNGVSWNDNPAVKAALAATIKDSALLKTITDTPGPSAPIELVDGKVTAWACEQHNCGPHQWAVLIDPATGAADVCYFNEATSATEARWLLAGGKEEQRAGNCSFAD
ncbi:MAG: hypothetical protein DI569_02725 [Sphingopyxis macrogoltabida]|uniref:Lipoprotein n=1 Tax=Sphingopyxis macrogoltabida TaxID=33050 RepID=A0A2W5NC71_SPHMC|nr:MAG: hypothetical protein DI569_02725 [Sphingopyxis macrogoltabida]